MSVKLTATSLNALWSELILEELVRLGVQDICIAPGSRSSPLTLAAANQGQLKTHLHYDERGLGFLALGLAKGSQRPVALIVTSGSAVANVLPAVVEARQSNVPLWILTADRPAELIGIGANQAIQQYQIFADYPVHSCYLPGPDSSITPGWLLSVVDQAAFQQTLMPGPVHINCPFREPLYPDATSSLADDNLRGLDFWLNASTPWTTYQSATPMMAEHLAWQHLQQQKGLIVIGRIQDQTSAKALQHWIEQTGWPVIADIQSQLRFHPNTLNFADQALHHPEFIEALSEADTLVMFGSRLTSKRLQHFLNQHTWQHCWQIDESAEQLDNGLAVQQRFVCSIEDWCQVHTFQDQKPWHRLGVWDDYLAKLVDENLPEWGEITLCHQLNQLVRGRLFIGNSMPIRLLDMLGAVGTPLEQVFTNRGASGIDGLLATAAGIAKSDDHTPLTIILGDTSALFDFNSLSLFRDLTVPVVILVINNDGGNIFHMLPVPETNNIRTNYYQLPHGMNFESAAEQFSLRYQKPLDQKTFVTAYQTALSTVGTTLIECQVETGAAAQWLKGLVLQLKSVPCP